MRRCRKNDGLDEWERLAGLRVIPGTSNLQLPKPFDLSLLTYLRFSEIGWDFDPATQGLDFQGHIAMYYRRVTIFNDYPGIVVFWSWVPQLNTHAELISPVHLKTAIGLKDGDTVEFSLYTEF